MQNKNTNNIRDFLRYNNAVPLFLAMLIIISGSAFAATPTGQEVISQTMVGKTEKVVTVDNTFLASINLDNWTPRVQVTGVTEDIDNYYVKYNLSTINIASYKWQNVVEQYELKVSKDFLKEFKSLEAYVKYELSQKIDAEKDRLVRTQEIEKKNVTQMQTFTSYSGLAGLVLDDTTTVSDPFASAPESATPGPENNTVAQAPTSAPQQNIEPENIQTNNLNNTDTASTATSSVTAIPASTTPVIDTSILNATTSETTTTPVPAPTTSTTTEPTETLPLDQVVNQPETTDVSQDPVTPAPTPEAEVIPTQSVPSEAAQ